VLRKVVGKEGRLSAGLHLVVLVLASSICVVVCSPTGPSQSRVFRAQKATYGYFELDHNPFGPKAAAEYFAQGTESPALHFPKEFKLDTFNESGTCLFFGKKGSGKTACRLSLKAKLEREKDNFVVEVDGDRFVDTIERNVGVGKWKTEDFVDMIVAEGFNKLGSSLVEQEVEVPNFPLLNLNVVYVKDLDKKFKYGRHNHRLVEFENDPRDGVVQKSSSMEVLSESSISDIRYLLHVYCQGNHWSHWRPPAEDLDALKIPLRLLTCLVIYFGILLLLRIYSVHGENPAPETTLGLALIVGLLGGFPFWLFDSGIALSDMHAALIFTSAIVAIAVLVFWRFSFWKVVLLWSGVVLCLIALHQNYVVGSPAVRIVPQHFRFRNLAWRFLSSHAEYKSVGALERLEMLERTVHAFGWRRMAIIVHGLRRMPWLREVVQSACDDRLLSMPTKNGPRSTSLFFFFPLNLDDLLFDLHQSRLHRYNDVELFWSPGDLIEVLDRHFAAAQLPPLHSTGEGTRHTFHEFVSLLPPGFLQDQLTFLKTPQQALEAFDEALKRVVSREAADQSHSFHLTPEELQTAVQKIVEAHKVDHGI